MATEEGGGEKIRLLRKETRRKQITGSVSFRKGVKIERGDTYGEKFALKRGGDLLNNKGEKGN